MAPGRRLTAERLRKNPEDPNGWKLLGRTYVELQHYAEAADAYRRALALSGERPDIATDYAEALVFAADGHEQHRHFPGVEAPRLSAAGAGSPWRSGCRRWFG